MKYGWVKYLGDYHIYITKQKKQNKKTKPKQTNRQCLKSMKCSFK